MSSRVNTLEITKTRTGNRLCLEVPSRKLGAVLCAIGSALDGHPWIPHRESKSRTRGSRGGRKNREKRSAGASNAGGTAGSALATNSPACEAVKMVCPKLPIVTNDPPASPDVNRSPAISSGDEPKPLVSKAQRKRALRQPSGAIEAQLATVSLPDDCGSIIAPSSCGDSEISTAPPTDKSKRIADLRTVAYNMCYKYNVSESGRELVPKPHTIRPTDNIICVRDPNPNYPDRYYRIHKQPGEGAHYNVCHNRCECAANHIPEYVEAMLELDRLSPANSGKKSEEIKPRQARYNNGPRR